MSAGTVAGVLRRLADLLGALLAALALFGLVLRLVPFRWNVLIAGAAASSWLVALALPAFVLLAARRRKVRAAVAAALTAAAVALLLPTYVGGGAAAGAVRLTVLTANLRLGSAVASAVVDDARSTGADIVLLQELTGDERSRLAAAGLDALLPYSVVDARWGASGVGLWSRYPLADEQRHGGFVFAAVSARVLLGRGRPAPTVLTVHMPGPWPQPAGDWVRDIGRLPALMAAVGRDGAGPDPTVLVGGDFNATYGNAQFRHLLTGGFRDAAQLAGAPWTATYPANSRLVPPVIGIDHVLARSAGASDVTTLAVSGSDHRGLVAHLTLPDH